MGEEGGGGVSKGKKEKEEVDEVGPYTVAFASREVGKGPHRGCQEDGGSEEGDGSNFRRHNVRGRGTTMHAN